MKQEQIFMKKILTISLVLMLLGSGIIILGYSFSGFNLEKYQSDHKRWYQVITIPNR